jgi:hypothetical protein
MRGRVQLIVVVEAEVGKECHLVRREQEGRGYWS